MSFERWGISKTSPTLKSSGITDMFLRQASDGTVNLYNYSTELAQKVLRMRPELRLEYIGL